MRQSLRLALNDPTQDEPEDEPKAEPLTTTEQAVLQRLDATLRAGWKTLAELERQRDERGHVCDETCIPESGPLRLGRRGEPVSVGLGFLSPQSRALVARLRGGRIEGGR